MTARRVAVVLAVAALFAVIPLGRWERNRSIEARNAGIRATLRAVGPGLYNRKLSGYRLANPFACLTYADGPVTFRRELCFDSGGRIVEAIDRLHEPAKIWSFRERPGESTIRIAPSTVYAVLRRLHAVSGAFTGSLPTSTYDVNGPTMRGTLVAAGVVGQDVGTGITAYRFRAGDACLQSSHLYWLCFDRDGVLVRSYGQLGGIDETTPAADAPAALKPGVLRAILRKIGAPAVFPSGTTPIVRVKHGS